MNTPPPVFGDPTRVQTENKRSIAKGFGLGCGGCALLVLALAGVTASLIGVVFYFLSNSEAAVLAMKQVQASPEVQAALGEPIQKGWFTAGNVNTFNGNSRAQLQFQITGPKDSAEVQLQAEKHGDAEWKFLHLKVKPTKAEAPIDLMQNLNR
jgi:hypothetical protein